CAAVTRGFGDSFRPLLITSPLTQKLHRASSFSYRATFGPHHRANQRPVTGPVDLTQIMTIDRKFGRELMCSRHTFRKSTAGWIAPAHHRFAVIVFARP